jgi:hypothetical protein
MATPSRIFGDEPGQEAQYTALLECIVRATPFTVRGTFADRALSNAAAEILIRTSANSSPSLAPVTADQPQGLSHTPADYIA